ncbi:oligosaccharide flippase family protein [Megasphaera elsdenii]|uniref:oligosaccharide flippase family protein n=1 Tax=Megasphaera elsdenii TaxID=907 RepID=UPI00403682C8
MLTIKQYFQNDKIRHFISNMGWLYIMQITMYIFPLITFPYMTHVLEPELFGVYTYVIAIMTYFQIFWDFGFTLSATRSCAENSENKQRLSEIVSAVLILKGGLFIVGIGTLPVISFLSELLNGQELFLYGMYFAFGINVFLPDYLFRGIEKMKIFVLRNLLTKGLFTILLIIVVKSSADFYKLPLIFFVPNLISVIWSFKIMNIDLDIHFCRPSKKDIFGEFKTSLGYFISRVSTTASDSLNTILLGGYFNASTIGIYGVSNSLKNVFCNACSPLADALFPYTVKNKNFKLIQTILFYLMPIALIACIILYVFADRLISLLCGSQYIEAAFYFRMFLYIVFITLPIYVLGYPALCAMDKANEANLSVIYAGIFQIIGLLCLILFHIFTIDNVILLTMGSNTITLLFRVYFCRDILFLHRS